MFVLSLILEGNGEDGAESNINLNSEITSCNLNVVLTINGGDGGYLDQTYQVRTHSKAVT